MRPGTGSDGDDGIDVLVTVHLVPDVPYELFGHDVTRIIAQKIAKIKNRNAMANNITRKTTTVKSMCSAKLQVMDTDMVVIVVWERKVENFCWWGGG